MNYSDLSQETQLFLNKAMDVYSTIKDKSINKVVKDLIDTKSTRDLKNLVEEYRLSQLDLLDAAYQKRTNVRECRSRLTSLISKLEDYEYFKQVWTIEKITEELKDINKELIKSTKKYDYSKLPKDNP